MGEPRLASNPKIQIGQCTSLGARLSDGLRGSPVPLSAVPESCTRCGSPPGKFATDPRVRSALRAQFLFHTMARVRVGGRPTSSPTGMFVARQYMGGS